LKKIAASNKMSVNEDDAPTKPSNDSDNSSDGVTEETNLAVSAPSISTNPTNGDPIEQHHHPIPVTTSPSTPTSTSTSTSPAAAATTHHNNEPTLSSTADEHDESSSSSSKQSAPVASVTPISQNDNDNNGNDDHEHNASTTTRAAPLSISSSSSTSPVASHASSSSSSSPSVVVVVSGVESNGTRTPPRKSSIPLSSAASLTPATSLVAASDVATATQTDDDNKEYLWEDAEEKKRMSALAHQIRDGKLTNYSLTHSLGTTYNEPSDDVIATDVSPLLVKSLPWLRRVFIIIAGWFARSSPPSIVT
jgi:hypothetical protein